MTDPCPFCGGRLAGGKYCPSCGAQQPDRSAPKDSLVGRVIADRYEIVELISEGGMGRVYRARQRALDRDVAIKLVLRHHLASEAMSARFLQEARAASRLNHPNVISVFDFGRAALPEGEQLFLVMELVSGPDLASVLANDSAMSLHRIADILRQVLAALGEAHHLGVTHRDIKPENVLLEPRRGGGDRVKVIDFGIARLGGDARLTRAGEFVGTPLYIAPELIRGDKPTPSSDLYSVGVLLFQMLTGQCPFDAPTSAEILTRHLVALRPDPRAVAPQRAIPAALAEVCIRAIDVDAAKRYPSAEALAEAIVRAATSKRWSASDASLFPSRLSATGSSNPAASDDDANIEDDTGDPAEGMPSVPRLPAESLESIDLGAPLVGRDIDLAWAQQRLGDRLLAGFAFSGGPGIGRTRMLHEVIRAAMEMGAVVYEVTAPPRPLSEISFSALRTIVARLVELEATDPALASGAAASGSVAAAEGLQQIFRGSLAASASTGAARAAADALRWAAQRAVRSATPARVVLAIDDFDRLDPASRRALGDVLNRGPIRRFAIALTTQAPLAAPTARAPIRALRGLSRTEATQLLGPDAELLPASRDEFEPLYVEQLRRWPAKMAHAVPATLRGLVEARVLQLPPAQRRALQAVALVGMTGLDDLGAIVSRPEDLEEALRPLADNAFIEVHRGEVSLTHASFARAALANGPAGAIAELHRRRATLLSERHIDVELHAFHAIRGQPDFEAFLLVEETARRRSGIGEPEGAIAALWEGMHAARSLLSKGPNEAALSALITYGRKLAALQVELGRYHEARAVLSELAGLVALDDVARIQILEQLADVAQQLERPEEEERLRREASETSERISVRSLAVPLPLTERPVDDKPGRPPRASR